MIAQVVDVGPGRAGDQLVVQRGEEGGAVVAGERRRRVAFERATEPVEEGAGGEAGAVDAVAVRGQPATSSRPARRIAAASAYSWLGPPRPGPVTVTVSSPPERSRVSGDSRAISAWRAPASRASPSLSPSARTR